MEILHSVTGNARKNVNTTLCPRQRAQERQYFTLSPATRDRVEVFHSVLDNARKEWKYFTVSSAKRTTVEILQSVFGSTGKSGNAPICPQQRTQEWKYHTLSSATRARVEILDCSWQRAQVLKYFTLSSATGGSVRILYVVLGNARKSGNTTFR